MVIDQFLIGDVDQGKDKGENSARDGKTPVRDQLGKVVSDEGEDGSLCRDQYVLAQADSGATHGKRSSDILHKQDALSLNDDKVDELMHVTHKTINSLTRHRVVPTRTKLRGKPFVKQELARHLG